MRLLLEGLAELLSPTRCAGCELPGSLLCAGCRELALRFAPSESCPRCGAPFGALVCTECWSRQFAFEGALALGELAAPLARGVVLHKDAGERRLGAEFGKMLAARVGEQWPGWADVVTWIPGTPQALSRRGFDHAQALALPVAERLDLPASGLLGRGRARDQRSLGRLARAANAAETFSASPVSHARVLVVDDVLTTGATLDAASAVLLEAGAEAVRVAVIARAW